MCHIFIIKLLTQILTLLKFGPPFAYMLKRLCAKVKYMPAITDQLMIIVVLTPSERCLAERSPQ